MTIAVSEQIFVGAVFFGIVALFVYHVKRLRLYREAATFPGPRAIPIIGNALYFVGNTADILNKVTELLNSYPSPFKVWLGSRLIFGVYEPEQMKTIFLSPKTIEKDDLYKFSRPWVGTGLFTAPASKWRIHRKLIVPTFNSRILKSFVEVFVKQSEIMTNRMRKELNGNEFDVFHYVSLCTLDIICETAMGVTVKAQTAKDSRYVDSTRRVFEIIYTRMFKVWLHPDIIFNSTELGRDQRECLEYLHGVTNDVIRMKKSSYNSANCVDNESAHERSTMRKAFLDLLMELSKDGTKFTDEELREEVETMMIAGNDTTASVLSFVILMLANYPDIQEKVYQELWEIYGGETSSDRPITNEDLNRMEYLERVIKETLRLFPIGPIILRQVTDDLNVGEYTLPKGSSVTLGILKLHRWEKYWPDPLKFDPERFLPEHVANRHPYCYVPFSAGPRNCLGIKFAMMSMKVILATILRLYVLKREEILTIEDIKLKADILLKPVKPVTIRIEKREVNARYE